MVTTLVLLLLPVAAWSGWYFARREHTAETLPAPCEHRDLPQDYLTGLRYLLNEQPDKAVDIFIKIVEANSETVEIHLALGLLFRRRGEADRAIRIHQNLIARPQLSRQQRLEALLALGEDYLRAGVLDRAERLFLEVVDAAQNPELLSSTALGYLLDIYQQQRRWDAAIEIATKLVETRPEVREVVAHYYCELAALALKNNQHEIATQHLKMALQYDNLCVRASLMLMRLCLQKGEFAQALHYCQQIKQQDPGYLSEIIPPLEQCYQSLGREEDLQTYLQQCFVEYPRSSLLTVLAKRMVQTQGVDAAIQFTCAHLHKHPSLRGLQCLVDLQLQNAQGQARESLKILQEVITGLLAHKPLYRCILCGFQTKVLSWFCPSCKHWNKIKPIQGLEGE